MVPWCCVKRIGGLYYSAYLAACQTSFLEKIRMARACTVCGKGPITGNNVSHANNRKKRRWYPNLQTVRVLVEGAPRRVSVCTQCIKSNRIKKAT